MSKSKPTPILISRSSNNFWLSWAPPLLWTLALLAFSGDAGSSQFTKGLLQWILSGIVTLSPQDLDVLHRWLRKAGHVLAYGILSVLWFRSLSLRYPGRLAANIALALALSLAVSLIDEGHQFLVSSRQGSLGDVALDMTGAVLMTAMAGYFRKWTSLAPPEARPPSP
jgi:VanZ family protein